jgi:hypothetical protein
VLFKGKEYTLWDVKLPKDVSVLDEKLFDRKTQVTLESNGKLSKTTLDQVTLPKLGSIRLIGYTF